jgi:hypothetical protein
MMAKASTRFMWSAGMAVALLAATGFSATACATVTPQNAFGCNEHACINVTGPASGYTATASPLTNGSTQYLLSVFGPGCPTRNTPVEKLGNISCKGHGAGKVCAEILEFDSFVGAWVPEGEPCETVS